MSDHSLEHACDMMSQVMRGTVPPVGDPAEAIAGLVRLCALLLNEQPDAQQTLRDIKASNS